MDVVTHYVSVGRNESGWVASCSCGWSEVAMRNSEIRGFICPAPDDRGKAMKLAVEHQRGAKGESTHA